MRMQQIMAYKTDLLNHDDLFDGNPAVDRKVAELKDSARHELANLDAMGGAISAIEYMKSRLVESNANRLNRIESNTTTVVGRNPQGRRCGQRQTRAAAQVSNGQTRA